MPLQCPYNKYMSPHTLTTDISYECHSYTFTTHTFYECHFHTLTIHISYECHSHNIKRYISGSLLLITKNDYHWAFEWNLPARQTVCPVTSHHGLHFQSDDYFHSTISNSEPYGYTRILTVILCCISEQFPSFQLHEIKSKFTGMELISFLYKVQREGKDYARADVTV